MLPNQYKKNMNTHLSNFVPAFKIFKKGTTTEGTVTIFKDINTPFNKDAKKSLYKSLGYTVIEIK